MDHKIWTDDVIQVNVGGTLRFWLLYNFVFNARYKTCLLQTHSSTGRSPYKLVHRVIRIIWKSSSHKNNNYYNKYF